jgi:hypothetical protein
VCESSKQAKGGKFLWAVTTILDSQVFVHEQQAKRKIRELGAGASMEGEFGACWSGF